MTFTRFRKADEGAEAAVAELMAVGHVESSVALFLEGFHAGSVSVRPVIEDEAVEWLPAFEAALEPSGSGVTGFVGSNATLAGLLAAETAAWLGDRGMSIVLVDACVEDPVISKPLPEDGDEGLVDAVLFAVSPSVVVRRTLAAGVSVVTAGSHPITSERVFESDALPATLRALGSDAALFVVLPEDPLDSMLDVLDVVVVIDESPDVLSHLADRAGNGRARRVGVLAAPPGRILEEPLRVPRRTPEPEQVEPEPPAPVTLPERQEPEIPEEVKVETAERTPEPEVVPAVPLRIGRPERRRLGGAMWLAVIMAAVIVTGFLYWRYAMPPGQFGRSDGETFVTRTETEEPEGSAAGAPGEMTETAANAGGGETETPAAADETQVEEGAGVPGAGDIQGEHVPAEAEPEITERPPAQLEGVLSGPGGPYRLMISSHRFERDAILESAETERRGVASEVVPAEIADRGTWYRVVVAGGYPRLAAAREVLDIVKSLGYEGAWIERTDGGN